MTSPREKREAAVVIAQRELTRGVHEATGKNDGPDIEKYLQGDKGLAWCAAFVIWCFEKADVKFPGNRWKNRNVAAFYRNLRECGFVLEVPEGRLPTSVRPVDHLELWRRGNPSEVGQPDGGPPVGAGGTGRPDLRQLGTAGPSNSGAVQPGNTLQGNPLPPIIPLRIPAPGDLIFLSRRGRSDAGTGWHMGIVERVDMENITSIDGNWADKVSRVHRSWSDLGIVGFGRFPADDTGG